MIRQDGILDSSSEVSLTQTGRKKHYVQVGEKLLLVGIEMPQSRNDVSGQADADYLQNGAEHEHDEVPECRVRFMLILQHHE